MYDLIFKIQKIFKLEKNIKILCSSIFPTPQHIILYLHCGTTDLLYCTAGLAIFTELENNLCYPQTIVTIIFYKHVSNLKNQGQY
jgi:hypothetical protein